MSNRLFILFHQINTEEISTLIKEHEISEIINFSNNNSSEIGVNIPTLLSHEIEDFDLITKKTIVQYTNFVSEFSKEIIYDGKTIRDLTIVNLPIYWFIPFSVKHPYNQWGYNFFLLKNFLISQQKTSSNNFVYLPKELNNLSSFLTSFLQPFNIELIGDKTNLVLKKISTFNLIKSNIINIHKILKVKPNNAFNTIKNKSIIFFNTKKESSYINKVEKSIIDTLKLKGLSSENFSYLDWTTNPRINASFYRKRPSILILSKVLIHSIFLKIQLKKYKKNIYKSNNPFCTELVLNEIENFITTKSHYLYSFIWLKNYFRDSSNIKAVFYEDEFYTYGRIISAAKKSTIMLHHFNCYGIQHGMFSDFHTVYHLSDDEIESTSHRFNNGIPLPDFFITWGEYFSNQLLKNNSLKKKFIKELGNPIYVFNQDGKNNKINDGSHQNFTFLYCLTSQILLEKELPIVNRILSIYPNSTLITRCHPNFIFKINPNIFDSTCKVISSSNSNIFDDFKISDIILTSAHSTVFLDALANNKNVIRLKTSISDSSMNYNSTNCLTLDFLDKIPELIIKQNQSSSSNNFLFLEKDRWEVFIDNINA